MTWYLHRTHVDSFSGWFVGLFVVTLAWGDENKHISLVNLYNSSTGVWNVFV